jgi:hypothetical protein
MAAVRNPKGMPVKRMKAKVPSAVMLRAGEVVPGREGVRVVRAEDPLSVGEGLFEQGDGAGQVPGRLVRVGEVVPAGEGVGWSGPRPARSRRGSARTGRALHPLGFSADPGRGPPRVDEATASARSGGHWHRLTDPAPTDPLVTDAPTIPNRVRLDERRNTLAEPVETALTGRGHEVVAEQTRQTQPRCKLRPQPDRRAPTGVPSDFSKTP